MIMTFSRMIAAISGILLLVAAIGVQADESRREGNEELEAEGGKLKPAAPGAKLEYTHTHDNKKRCTFTLDGKRAEYMSSGGPRTASLDFERTGKVKDLYDETEYEGWVYRLQGEDRWYFFGATPVANRSGPPIFPFYESSDPRNPKSWTRLILSGGTTRKIVGNFSQQEFAEIVRQGIRERSIGTDGIDIKIKPGVVEYYLGRLGIRSSHPFEAALTLQVTVETIRATFRNQNLAPWGDSLSNVEQIVARELTLIPGQLKVDDMNALLEEDSAAANRQLEKGFETWGKATRHRPIASYKGQDQYLIQVKPTAGGKELTNVQICYAWQKVLEGAEKHGRVSEFYWPRFRGELPSGYFYFRFDWQGQRKVTKRSYDIPKDRLEFDLEDDKLFKN
jgi:hypothetical protein